MKKQFGFNQMKISILKADIKDSGETKNLMAKEFKQIY